MANAQTIDKAIDAAPAENNRQLVVLTALLQLERRARAAATVEEFGFLAVNETLGLVRAAMKIDYPEFR